MRLLCQESISISDLDDASLLIQDFVLEYESLYGVDSMLSNVHGHLHLPQQVFEYGPLDKVQEYVFENQFKIAHTSFHGTRNIEGQIAKSIYQHKAVEMMLNSLKKLNQNENINFFIRKHLSNETIITEDLMLKPTVLKIHLVDLFIRQLIAEANLDTSGLFISLSENAQIKKKVYNTEAYDQKFDHIDCHNIEYRKYDLYGDLTLRYGIIMRFLTLKDINYIIVKRYERMDHDHINNGLSLLCKKHINKFFIRVEISTEFELVPFDKLTRRCILSHAFLGPVTEKIISPCKDLNEHD